MKKIVAMAVALGSLACAPKIPFKVEDVHTYHDGVRRNTCYFVVRSEAFGQQIIGLGCVNDR